MGGRSDITAFEFVELRKTLNVRLHKLIRKSDKFKICLLSTDIPDRHISSELMISNFCEGGRLTCNVVERDNPVLDMAKANHIRRELSRQRDWKTLYSTIGDIFSFPSIIYGKKFCRLDVSDIVKELTHKRALFLSYTDVLETFNRLHSIQVSLDFDPKKSNLCIFECDSNSLRRRQPITINYSKDVKTRSKYETINRGSEVLGHICSVLIGKRWHRSFTFFDDDPDDEEFERIIRNKRYDDSDSDYISKFSLSSRQQVRFNMIEINGSYYLSLVKGVNEDYNHLILYVGNSPYSRMNEILLKVDSRGSVYDIADLQELRLLTNSPMKRLREIEDEDIDDVDSGNQFQDEDSQPSAFSDAIFLEDNDDIDFDGWEKFLIDGEGGLEFDEDIDELENQSFVNESSVDESQGYSNSNYPNFNRIRVKLDRNRGGFSIKVPPDIPSMTLINDHPVFGTSALRQLMTLIKDYSDSTGDNEIMSQLAHELEPKLKHSVTLLK
jgi:hypothetical protein